MAVALWTLVLAGPIAAVTSTNIFSRHAEIDWQLAAVVGLVAVLVAFLLSALTDLAAWFSISLGVMVLGTALLSVPWSAWVGVPVMWLIAPFISAGILARHASRKRPAPPTHDPEEIL